MCTTIIYVPKLNSVNPEGSIFSLLLIIYIIVLGFLKKLSYRYVKRCKCDLNILNICHKSLLMKLEEVNKV